MYSVTFSAFFRNNAAMVIVKIFISTDSYYGSTSGYLFGYVTQFNESFTFYLLRNCSDKLNSVGNGQLLGEICSDVTDNKDAVKNTVNFVQFVNGSTSILLNRITIDGITDLPIELTQIILYDHTKWIQISVDFVRDVEDVITDDCIKCLSLFIGKEFRNIEANGDNSSRWNVKYLLMFTFVLTPIWNMIHKLAVVKHMMDWYRCLNSGLQRK